MDDTTRTHLNNLWTSDRALQNEAYYAIMAATDQPVAWAYEVWDEVVANLTHKDNHNRAIAAQVLCGLAKSDPDQRILRDFDALIHVTRDERFVTARHALQSLWKVGAAGSAQQARYMQSMEQRFTECATEKNCTLIRYDIIESMKKVYDATQDAAIREKALALIETEPDAKYRKKYAGVWK